jgi:hypothetical protein
VSVETHHSVSPRAASSTDELVRHLKATFR